MLYIGSKFYIGKVGSAVKHSAASKLDQQINEEDGEKKKKNDSGRALEEPLNRPKGLVRFFNILT